MKRLALLVLLCGCTRHSPMPSDTLPPAAHAEASLPTPAHAVGCYRANRPLGTAASRYVERDLSGIHTFELVEGGKVERPDLLSPTSRELWAMRSRWTSAGDTLFIQLMKPPGVGWDLRLAAEAAGETTAYSGSARYLTDVTSSNTSALGAYPASEMLRVVRGACR